MRRMILRRIAFCIAFCAIASVDTHAQDVVLVGGVVVDGSGKPGAAANVRIRNGRIEEIGAFRPRPGEATINVKGLVVAPGFIDVHNHSAGLIDQELGAPTQIMQGITTAAFGLDGEGPILVNDFMARFDENPPVFNVVVFAGHNTVRRQVMGQDYRRAATPEEIRRMEDAVEIAMRQGAFGLSSNLESGPGAYSTLDELVALARAASRYAGVFVCHVRNEGDGAIEAVREAIEVGRRAKIPVHISHLKLGSAAVWGKAAALLAEIDAARKQGVDVTADVFPYNSSESDLAALLRGQSPERQAAARAVKDAGGAANILIVRAEKRPDYSFKTLEQVAGAGVDPIDVYLQILRDGGGRAIVASMAEKDVRTLMRHASVMVASDGGVGYAHPRSAGTFPRVLGMLVREEKLMSLEEAVRKMSTLPAARLGLKERGILRKGANADVVVFDPTQIRDKAAPEDPTALPEGVQFVFVNGVLTVKDGRPTGERAGAALR